MKSIPHKFMLIIKYGKNALPVQLTSIFIENLRAYNNGHFLNVARDWKKLLQNRIGIFDGKEYLLPIEPVKDGSLSQARVPSDGSISSVLDIKVLSSCQDFADFKGILWIDNPY